MVTPCLTLSFPCFEPNTTEISLSYSIVFPETCLNVCNKSLSEQYPAEEIKPNQGKSPQRICCGRLFLTTPVCFRHLGEAFSLPPQPVCISNTVGSPGTSCPLGGHSFSGTSLPPASCLPPLSLTFLRFSPLVLPQ